MHQSPLKVHYAFRTNSYTYIFRPWFSLRPLCLSLVTANMPLSSFITALSIDFPTPSPSQAFPPDDTAPLVLALCRFSIEGFQNHDFERYNITMPTRLQQALAKRRSEFLAGRLCAQHALSHLGIKKHVGSTERHRYPLWPSGCTGAITHSHGIAGALIGLTQHWQGIGLDIEHWIEPNSAQHLAKAILQPHEFNLLNGNQDVFAHQLTLVFSAKETLFKALNPLTGTSFYFHDASVQEFDKNTLMLRLDCDLNDYWRTGTTIACQYRYFPTHVMTWLTIAS